MPFRNLVGHRRLIDLLARSIHHDSLPPSLLFTGPDRAGKRLVAVGVAQALNCLDLPVVSTDLVGADLRVRPRADTSVGPCNDGFETDACGVCSACARIARGV